MAGVDAIRPRACPYDLETMKRFCGRLLVGLSFAFAISLGAVYSRSHPEPTSMELDRAVDWWLGETSMIRTDPTRALYDSYRILRQYREGFGNERRYVYFFRAQCPVVYLPIGRVDGDTWKNRTQPSTSSSHRKVEWECITGSVTLAKQGAHWSFRKTLHWHGFENEP